MENRNGKRTIIEFVQMSFEVRLGGLRSRSDGHGVVLERITGRREFVKMRSLFLRRAPRQSSSLRYDEDDERTDVVACDEESNSVGSFTVMLSIGLRLCLHNVMSTTPESERMMRYCRRWR